MSHYILSVVGSDRPGLTSALAGAVLAAGGNWLESHLSQLGGLYVGSVLVALAPERLEALREAVGRVDAEGLAVRIAPAREGAAAAAAAAAGPLLQLDLVGQDRPGIVNEVTAALGRLGANIETFRTWVVAGAHSGAPMFHMAATLALPAGLSADAVQAALEDISAEILVDISLTPAG
ncbi:MAG: glycine cleavage system protein R [Caulobacter sp.]